MSGLKIGGIKLTEMDMYSIKDGEFLNDNVLNLYLTLLREKCEEKQVSAFIAGTHLFTKIRKGEGVNWFKKQSILIHDWIYLPVHYNTHWSVLVCCNLRKYLLEKTLNNIQNADRIDRGDKSLFNINQIMGNQNLNAGIFSFDSLGKDYSKALNHIARYVVDRWIFECLESGYTGASCIDKTTLTKQFLRDLCVTKARVPVQRNGYDCGGFMLHYIELLTHPETLTVIEQSKNIMFWVREGLRGWFSPSDAEAKRKYISGLFKKLYSLQENGKDNLVSVLLSPRYVQRQVETALENITTVWSKATNLQNNKVEWNSANHDDDTSGCSAFSESDNDYGDILPIRDKHLTDEELERNARFNEMMMKGKGATQPSLLQKKPVKKRPTRKDSSKQMTLTGFVTSPKQKIKRTKQDTDDEADAETESNSSGSCESSSSSERKRKAEPVQPLITAFCSKDKVNPVVKKKPSKRPACPDKNDPPKAEHVNKEHVIRRPPPVLNFKPVVRKTGTTKLIEQKRPVSIKKKALPLQEGTVRRRLEDSDDQMTNSSVESPRKPERKRVVQKKTTTKSQSSHTERYTEKREGNPKRSQPPPRQPDDDSTYSRNPYSTLSHLNGDGDNRPRRGNNYQKSHRHSRGGEPKSNNSSSRSSIDDRDRSRSSGGQYSSSRHR